MEEELDRHTVALDVKYPALVDVREALEERRQAMVASLESKETARDAPQYFLVIDEKAIEYCGTLCADALAAVGNASRSVVACRARKDQKAQMLNLIKEGVPDSCCLAIGDGANDVAMIQAGQIGVAILGKEGREAANAADFAIGQFRFLRSLLLVHGRYNFRRLAIFIYFTFYKSVAVMLAQFFYATGALFSAPLLFIPLFVDFANPIMYTSLPVLLYAITDADVPKEIAAYMPELYARSMLRVYYTNRGFVNWLAEGCLTGMLSAYVPAILLSNADGTGRSRSAVSLATMWLVCIVCNFRLMMENHSWTILEKFGVTAMLLVLVVTTIAFSYLPFSPEGSFSWYDLYGTVAELFPEPSFWFCIMLTVVLALGPRMIVKARNILWRPSLVRLALHNLNPSDAKAAQLLRTDSIRQSVSNAYVSGRRRDPAPSRETGSGQQHCPTSSDAPAPPRAGQVPAAPQWRLSKRSERPSIIKKPTWKQRRSVFTVHEPSSNFVMQATAGCDVCSVCGV